jgi:hypothetical protein
MSRRRCGRDLAVGVVAGGLLGAATGCAPEVSIARVDGEVDGGLPPAKAFQDPFDTKDPGGRGGDLDERVWSFARWGLTIAEPFVRTPALTDDQTTFPASFCGKRFSGILPPADVRICDGPSVDGGVSTQIHEVLDDDGRDAQNSMRIRRPFDFGGRTGTLRFDVDAKASPLSMGHGWWVEVWITQDPAPMPQSGPAPSPPRRGVGFRFLNGDCPQGETVWGTKLATAIVIEGYAVVGNHTADDDIEHAAVPCFRTSDGLLNRLRLRISRERAELWASDFDDPTNVVLRSTVSNLDLGFTRGYVHLQHVQFDASKDGNVTRSQTYRWDNVAFDGPVLPDPRGYDVPDNDAVAAGGEGVVFGYPLSDGATKQFTLRDVDLAGATGATWNFLLHGATGQEIQYRLNEGPWHAFVTPENFTTLLLHSESVALPLDELVQGDNTIEMYVPVPTNDDAIANMDLTVDVADE